MRKVIKDTGLILPEVKLTQRQKLILDILQEEFKGAAYTREMLEESENTKEISMPSLTWNLNAMYDMALLTKEKGVYKGKPYTKYEISDYLKYDAIIIK